MHSNAHRLAAATLLAAFISSLTPGAVLANNGWTLRRDQNAITELVQEGVLTPNDANALAKRAYNLANGSLLHNNPISDLFSSARRMNVNSAFQSPRVAKRARKQLNTLQHDGVISGQQAARLTMETFSQVNAPNNRMMMNGFNGMPNMYGFPR